jgi:hypothetical protein
MNEKQINIAIAEACGWEQVEGEECFFDNGTEQVYIENIPDFCNDLNAMHGAEKMLNNEQWVAYGKELSRLKVFPMVHATASQRAEAFLKTLGKWEGAK